MEIKEWTSGVLENENKNPKIQWWMFHNPLLRTASSLSKKNLNFMIKGYSAFNGRLQPDPSKKIWNEKNAESLEIT